MEQSGRVGLSDDLSRKRSEAISPAPAAAAPEAKEDAPKVSPSNDAEDREESAGKVSAPAAAARGPAARRQPAPPEEKLMDLRSASASAGSPGRRLLVEYPAFTVSVFEDGLIALSAKEYSCAARLHDPPVDPDVAALFALASSSGGEARGSPGEASPGAPVVRLLDQQAAAGTETSTGGRVLAGMAREIGSRLSTILRDRYLVLMEARCGPPPLDVRSP
jgi:hypothetical protein